MKYRTPSEKSKYYIPKEDYLTAIHYSLRYPLLVEEIRALADTSSAIRYDRERVQTSNSSDPTFEAALKIEGISAKIKIIDDTIRETANGLDNYLRQGVCYGLTFDQLKGKGMPCERKMYYMMRRHYYSELSKRI